MKPIWSARRGLDDLDPADSRAWTCHDVFIVRVRRGVRPRLRRSSVIWLTVSVTLILFAYLLAALLRPEKF